MATNLRELKYARRVPLLILIMITIWFGPGVTAARSTPLFRCIPPEKTSGFGGSLWDSFLTDGDGFNPVKIKDNNGKLVYVGFYGSTHAAPDGEFIILCYADLFTGPFATDYLQEKLKTLRVTERKPRKNEFGIKSASGSWVFLMFPRIRKGEGRTIHTQASPS